MTLWLPKQNKNCTFLHELLFLCPSEWVLVPPPACALAGASYWWLRWGITEHAWLYLPHFVTTANVPEKGCEITVTLNPDCLGL